MEPNPMPSPMAVADRMAERVAVAPRVKLADIEAAIDERNVG